MKADEREARRIVRERAGGDEDFKGYCEIRIEGVCSGLATDWQHRKNRSQGGRYHAANGLALCSPCHVWVHRNPQEAAGKGWTVKSHMRPIEVPVVHAVHGRVFLDDHGGWRPAADPDELIELWGKAQRGDAA